MTMIDTIKGLSLQARKERNSKKSALFSTLLGEAQMVGKNNGNRESTDGEVVAVIKKMAANTKETIAILKESNTPESPSEITNLEFELEWLTKLLPVQITGETLALAIDALITENSFTSIKDMGKLMKIIKEKYDGQYDGTEASKIVKGKLS